MSTDGELKDKGIRVLIAELGEVQAARFISLLTRAPFDYTKWQASLWPDVDVEQRSREAMQVRGIQDVRGNPPE